MAASARRPDRRSAAAQEYRRLYKTAEWRAARAAQLAEQPLCELCEKRGRVTAATVVNHRVPHRGDWARFIDQKNLQSLCKPCHDGEVQARERTGRDYDGAAGLDGWPVDPRHPFYR